MNFSTKEEIYNFNIFKNHKEMEQNETVHLILI